jgi:hypothetical protein
MFCRYADFALLCLRFGYCIHRVDYQALNDLLQLHRIALHDQTGRGRIARKFDVTPMRHAADKSDHLPYGLVQVDILHFERGFPQHAAQAAYHFAGALIVTPDVRENFPNFVEVW